MIRILTRVMDYVLINVFLAEVIGTGQEPLE